VQLDPASANALAKFHGDALGLAANHDTFEIVAALTAFQGAVTERY
jgi:hypothetical protein